MLKRLNRQLLSLMTVLALLMQGMVFGGHAMAQTSDNQMHAMMMDGTSAMHCVDDTETLSMAADDCCNTDTATKACCDGNGSCTGDCSHCLSISVTGTLLSDNYWPEGFPSSAEVVSAIPHFHSVSLPLTLRPPIS